MLVQTVQKYGIYCPNDGTNCARQCFSLDILEKNRFFRFELQEAGMVKDFLLIK
jgi:hypothetical protein